MLTRKGGQNDYWNCDAARFIKRLGKYQKHGCFYCRVFSWQSHLISHTSLPQQAIPGCPSTLHIYACPENSEKINNDPNSDQLTQLVGYAKSAFRAFYEAFDRSGYRELPTFELYIELFQGNVKANISLDDILGYIEARRKEYYCAKLQRTYDIKDLQKFLLHGKKQR